MQQYNDTRLSVNFIIRESDRNVLYKQSYQRLTATPNQNSQEQCRLLSELLLLFIKAEYRKNEAPASWNEIHKKINAHSCNTMSVYGLIILVHPYTHRALVHVLVQRYVAAVYDAVKAKTA